MPRLSTIAGAYAAAWRWLTGLWHDLRHAARLFARNPAFTAIAVISIAFGTGANVAMFSLADLLLLRPLPVERPGEWLTIGTREKRGMSTFSVCSFPDYTDIRARTRTFTDLVASNYVIASIAPNRGVSPQVKLISIVNGGFFEALGVDPALGRGFLPEEDAVEGRNAVAVLSHAQWQQDFAGDPDVLGRPVYIGGIEFTIVGVAPESFTGLHSLVREAAFVPLAMWPRVQPFQHLNPFTARDLRALTVRGRIRPGVTLTAARAELAAIGAALEQAYPATNADRDFVVQTEMAVRFERSPLDSWLMVVLTTLSLAVLGVACANVAGLLASRAPVRSAWPWATSASWRSARSSSRPKWRRSRCCSSIAAPSRTACCSRPSARSRSAWALPFRPPASISSRL